MNTDPTFKWIHSVWILTQQSKEFIRDEYQWKEFILYQYLNNSQSISFCLNIDTTVKRNSFCINIDTAIKGLHFVWILTQQWNEFILYEYWHNSQRNSFFCVNIGTTVKEIQHAGGTVCALFTLSCQLAYSLLFVLNGIVLSMVNKVLLNWSKSNIFPYFWLRYNCIYWFESSVYLGWIPWDGLDIICYRGE